MPNSQLFTLISFLRLIFPVNAHVQASGGSLLPSSTCSTRVVWLRKRWKYEVGQEMRVPTWSWGEVVNSLLWNFMSSWHMCMKNMPYWSSQSALCNENLWCCAETLGWVRGGLPPPLIFFGYPLKYYLILLVKYNNIRDVYQLY